KDGKVYTFTLRKGVRFHQKPPVNGREVVADDVKYSLERFMAKSGFATRFEPVSSIDVIDRHTVRVTLKEPYAPFLNHLANSSVLRAGKAELPHVWGWVAPEEARSLKKTNPEMVVTPFQVIGQGFIYMRTDQPPFNDVRVRRAMSLAIERKAWNDALLFGEGCVDAGPVPCALGVEARRSEEHTSELQSR